MKPSRDAVRKMLAGLSLAHFALAFLMLFSAPLLFGDDCTADWRRAEDCLRTPGFAQGIGTGVGVIATVLVNGAAIATLVITPPGPVTQDGGSGGGGDAGNPPPPKQYFLNISTQDYRTTLKTDGQDSLWVYASVSCTDPNVDASALTSGLQFYVSGDNLQWLSMGQPVMTGGSMAVQVCAAPPMAGATLSPGAPCVTAGVSIEGTPVSGSVTLLLSNEFKFSAWAAGKKTASLTYSKRDKEWTVPEVVVYFHSPTEDTPVQPPFKYGFPDPAFTSEPADLFALDCCTSDDGISYSFKLKLNDPCDLERHFGPDLTQNRGEIKLTFTAIDEEQKEYKDAVTLVVAPAIVPLFWGWERDSRARAEKRTYKESEYGEFEFIADTEDELQLALIFVRSDKIEEGTDPSDYVSEAVDFVTLKKVEFMGKNVSDYSVDGDVPGGSGGSGATELSEFLVKANTPVLMTPDQAQPDLTLVVDAVLKGEQAKQYRQGDITVRIRLRPKFLFLKLLVVPGDVQNTSLAVAYVGTQPGKATALKDVTVEIDVKNPGGGAWLQMADAAEQKTNTYGVAMWNLNYRGMTWKNIGEARFKVRAWIKTPSGTPPSLVTYVEFDCGANGRQYLADLTANAGALELGNPAMRSRSKIGDWLWPDSLSGPLNNLCAMIGGGPPEHYTCGQLRDRIWGFTLARRFNSDPDVAAKMNGIDFGKYEIAPIHVYFGLNPAGTEDPYFIDPWWDQAFNPDKVVLTYTSEVVKLGACVTLLVTGGAAILLSMGVVGSVAAGIAAIKSWLTYGIMGTLYGVGEASYYVCGYGFHVGKTPLSGEQWMNESGTYKEAPSRWGETFFKLPGSERLKTGVISPVEKWL